MATITEQSDRIRSLIRDYLRLDKGDPSDHSVECFVGMLETGEAALSDFKEVGGARLAKAVEEARKNDRFTC